MNYVNVAKNIFKVLGAVTATGVTVHYVAPVVFEKIVTVAAIEAGTATASLVYTGVTVVTGAAALGAAYFVYKGIKYLVNKRKQQFRASTVAAASEVAATIAEKALAQVGTEEVTATVSENTAKTEVTVEAGETKSVEDVVEAIAEKANPVKAPVAKKAKGDKSTTFPLNPVTAAVAEMDNTDPVALGA